jgi:acetyl esterase/lipase
MSRLVVALCCLVFIQGCSTHALFDTFGPKDKGSKLAERDIAFGDHPRQQLDVYVPTGGVTNAPVLMFIYGGSWNTGEKNLYDFAGRAFAAKGYVTVIADYRLVPEVRFPSFLEDGAAAITWIDDNIAAYGGNADQLFLVGHSAGAYNAVMLALDDRFGVADKIDGVAGLAGPYDFYPWDTPVSEAAFDNAPNPAVTTQPVAKVTPAAPPMLLVTGTKDTTVRPRNTRRLAARLEENGVRVETRFYDGVDHIGPAQALSVTFRNKAPVLEDVTTFFGSIEAE